MAPRLAVAMVMRYYQGAITRTDIRTMPNRELLGYINAISIIEGSGNRAPKGLSGEAALEAMKGDPAITVK
jgi:hypothetical protein